MMQLIAGGSNNNALCLVEPNPETRAKVLLKVTMYLNDPGRLI